MIYSYIFEFFYSLIEGGHTGETYLTPLEDFVMIFNEGSSVETSFTFNEWLCHTFTIISIILIFIFLVLFIKWLFKFTAGLFKW